LLFGKVEHIAHHSRLGWRKRLHVVRRLGRGHAKEKPQGNHGTDRFHGVLLVFPWTIRSFPKERPLGPRRRPRRPKLPPPSCGCKDFPQKALPLPAAGGPPLPSRRR